MARRRWFVLELLVGLLANYVPGERRFFAIIDKWKLTARSLTADEYVRSRAEDERQAYLLGVGLNSRSEPAAGEYLPNYRWNEILGTFQKLLKRPDVHFQRPRDNWYEEQDLDLEMRQKAIPRENFDGPCFEFGLIVQLRSSRHRGFGFVKPTAHAR